MLRLGKPIQVGDLKDPVSLGKGCTKLMACLYIFFFKILVKCRG